jgi:hypothetical protein
MSSLATLLQGLSGGLGAQGGTTTQNYGPIPTFQGMSLGNGGYQQPASTIPSYQDPQPIQSQTAPPPQQDVQQLQPQVAGTTGQQQFSPQNPPTPNNPYVYQPPNNTAPSSLLINPKGTQQYPNIPGTTAPAPQTQSLTPNGAVANYNNNTAPANYSAPMMSQLQHQANRYNYNQAIAQNPAAQHPYLAMLGGAGLGALGKGLLGAALMGPRGALLGAYSGAQQGMNTGTNMGFGAIQRQNDLLAQRNAAANAALTAQDPIYGQFQQANQAPTVTNALAQRNYGTYNAAVQNSFANNAMYGQQPPQGQQGQWQQTNPNQQVSGVGNAPSAGSMGAPGQNQGNPPSVNQTGTISTGTASGPQIPTYTPPVMGNLPAGIRFTPEQAKDFETQGSSLEPMQAGNTYGQNLAQLPQTNAAEAAGTYEKIASGNQANATAQNQQAEAKYKDIQTKYYPQSTEAEIKFKGAQAYDAVSRANLYNRTTTLKYPPNMTESDLQMADAEAIRRGDTKMSAAIEQAMRAAHGGVAGVDKQAGANAQKKFNDSLVIDSSTGKKREPTPADGGIYYEHQKAQEEVMGLGRPAKPTSPNPGSGKNSLLTTFGLDN